MALDLKDIKGDKKKQTLMVIGTLLLVVIGYITLRRMSGQSSATATGSSTPTATGAEGAGPTTDQTGMQNQLDALSGQLTQLQDTLANKGTTHKKKTTPTSPVIGGNTQTPTQPTKPAAKQATFTATGTTKISDILNSFHITLAQFKQWNPTTETLQDKGKGVWKEGGAATETAGSRLIGGQTVKVGPAPTTVKPAPKPAHPAIHGQHQ